MLIFATYTIVHKILNAMKPTLLVLAAGMGSRYGGIKQMDSFGPSGETIIDYSIYDAIRSGFGKIVFIIRDEFRAAFIDQFEKKIGGRVATEYVNQEPTAFLGNFKMPPERSKPWGTAHAVLCARDVIHEPFAVINADDFYGRDAFEKCAAFLREEIAPEKYCLIGYRLGNTVSPHGSVSRGVCEIDEAYHLLKVVERTKVYVENGKIYYLESGMPVPVMPETPVSMNFWGFDESVFDFLENQFADFLQISGTDPKSEFFIPLVADNYIHKNKGVIKVIPTDAQWFGVTYREDAPVVQKSIGDLVNSGVYPKELWANP